MKDPLSPEELQAFRQQILEIFDTEYARALKSGAFAEAEIHSGSHIIAKIAAIVGITTAFSYPTFRDFCSLLEKYRQF